jgi:hypothetical protein
MRANVKSAIVLVVTLLLGIVVGSMATRALVKVRLERVRKVMEGPGVVGLVERRLHLTPEQREKVDPILRKYRPRLRTIHEKFRDQLAGELKPTLDSLKAELEPHLTERQKRRLEHPRKGGRFGPGPHMRPGGSGPMAPKPMQQRPRQMMRRLEEALSLADGQRDTVRAILRKYAPGRGRGPGRMEPPPPEGVLDRMDALRQDLKGVLTPEQLERLDTMRLRPPMDDERW